MRKALPWLRADVGDHCFLARVLELGYTELAAGLAIVTEDRNLQNKARFGSGVGPRLARWASPRPPIFQ